MGVRCCGGEVGRPGEPDAKKCKAKKAREIPEDQTQRADAIRPEAGSVHLEKNVILLMRKTRTTPQDEYEYLLSSPNRESAPLSTLKSVCKEYNLLNNLKQADHVY